MRKAFAAPFRERAIRPLETLVRKQVLDSLACWPASGQVEVVDSFAFLLPVRVMSLMLGVPLTDVPRIHAWALGLTTALDSATEAALAEGATIAREIADYFRALIARREQLPAGTLITALIGAAHRDPAVFAEPDRFDVTRRGNRHIAFGAGIHHCLGVWLARLEARVAFTELLPRVCQLQVLDYRWRDLSAFRSLEFLKMKVDLQC